MRTLLGEVTLHLTGGKQKCRRIQSQRPTRDSKPQTIRFFAEELGEALFRQGRWFASFSGSRMQSHAPENFKLLSTWYDYKKGVTDPDQFWG